MGRDPKNVERVNQAEGLQDALPDSSAFTEQSSDSDLVASVCNGNDEAFELLFERHKVRVSAIAGRFFQDHVEDIVQECFTRAYFALSSFSVDGEGSFGAWIAKIAFNTCYDEMRRRGRRRENFISELASDDVQTIQALTGESGTESVVVSRDLANKLLAQLSPEDQLVLILLEVEGLSVSEIGRAMGWSTAKVKVRAFRARAQLRRILQRFL